MELRHSYRRRRLHDAPPSGFVLKVSGPEDVSNTVRATDPNHRVDCSCLAPVLIPSSSIGKVNSSQSAPGNRRSKKGEHRFDAFVAPGGAGNTKGRFKLTSDFALLAHLTRATRPRNQEEKWAVRVGATSTEEALGNPEGERIKVQAFKTSLGADGKRRWSLTLLQKHDRFLTGVYQDVTTTIKYKNLVANVTLSPGLHTLTWID